MKKSVSLFIVFTLVVIALTGCGRAADEKLCRIEIVDSNQNVISIMENQSQSDISEFFDETQWKESEKPIDNPVTKYVISVYQEKTKTVVKTDSDDYEKIMEYVIFENSEIVKVSIGGDVVNGMVPDELFDEYYIASSDFFSRINDIAATNTI
ncbi:MAG: hypothetical protein K2L19_09325 [Eubacterium sp.]|nr:hypothetical protein [Eubacterium sp.]